MTSIITGILYTLVVLIAIGLVALILVQPSKSNSSFGSAFGGLGESVFGAQAMGHLAKLTVWCFSVFFLLTLALAVISGHSSEADETSVMEGVAAQAEVAAPTLPAQESEAPALPPTTAANGAPAAPAIAPQNAAPVPPAK